MKFERKARIAGIANQLYYGYRYSSVNSEKLSAMIRLSFFSALILLVFTPAIAQLSGSYTIGGAKSDFRTIDSAFDVLASKGVKGPVVFQIREGIYHERLDYRKVPGANQTNSVTLDKYPTDTGKVFIMSDAPDSKNNYIVAVLFGYINFNNIHFELEGSNAGFGRIIYFRDTVEYVRFTNCSFNGYETATRSSVFSLMEKPSGNLVRNLWVENCSFNRGAYSISIFGGDPKYGIPDSNIIIRNNLFSEFRNTGLNFSHTQSLAISENVIRNYENAFSTVGINLDNLHGTDYVEGNRIELIRSGYGLVLNCSALTSDTVQIFNNVINGLNSKSHDWMVGIELSSARNCNILNNTIFIPRINADAIGVNFYSYSIYSTQFLNNNVVNLSIGPALVRTFSSSYGFVSDYNNLFNATGHPIEDKAVDSMYTLSDAQSLGIEMHSVSAEAYFEGDSNLRSHSWFLDGKATPVSIVKKDIDGNLRDSKNPDIGVNEFNPYHIDAGILRMSDEFIEVCGQTNQYVQLIVANFGNDPIDSISIEFVSLSPGGNRDTLYFTYPDTLDALESDTLWGGPLSINEFGEYLFCARSFVDKDESSVNDRKYFHYFSKRKSILNKISDIKVCNGSRGELKYPTVDGLIEWFTDPLKPAIDTSFKMSVDAVKKDQIFYYRLTNFNRENLGFKEPEPTTGFLMDDYGLEFHVTRRILLDSVTVYPVDTGVIYVLLESYQGVLIDTLGSFNVSGSGKSTPVHLPLHAWLDTGTYVMAMRSTGITDLLRDNVEPTVYPMVGVDSAVIIKCGRGSGNYRASNKFYYFYDWVVRVPYCPSPIDSATMHVVASPKVDLGKDTIVCMNDPKQFTLDAGAGMTSYFWQPAGTDRFLTVTKSGTYIVNVLDSNKCQATDQIVVSFFDKPYLYIGRDTQVCQNEYMPYSIGTNEQFAKFEWNNGDTTSHTTMVNDGLYILKTINENGCILYDSIELKLLDLPNLDLGNDVGFCPGEKVDTNLLLTGTYTSVLWDNGSQSMNYKVNSTGNYSVRVGGDNGCYNSDTVSFYRFMPVKPMIGSDTVYCSNTAFTKTFDAGKKINYIWQDGSTGRYFTADSAGLYFVNVTDTNGCASSDSVWVKTKEPVTLSLGNDTGYCANKRFSKLINLSDSFDYYLWDDGSRNSYRLVDHAAIYSVEAVDYKGCISRDTVYVVLWPVPIINLEKEVVVNPDEKVNLTLDAGPDYTTYQWKTGSNKQTAIVKDTGTYWVKVTNEFGCAQYDTVRVRYWHAVGLKKTESNSILVYPNPANGTVTLSNLNGKKGTIHLYDIYGQSILVDHTNGTDLIVLETSSLTSGTYWLVWKCGTDIFRNQLQIIH
ncbi:MAG: T9SS type A sorting domain-containing protein [Bacteroidetes bacterium]|nr:T9SS type A sorting domain-containing protein [Bacteroidota bacterium]